MNTFLSYLLFDTTRFMQNHTCHKHYCLFVCLVFLFTEFALQSALSAGVIWRHMVSDYCAEYLTHTFIISVFLERENCLRKRKQVIERGTEMYFSFFFSEKNSCPASGRQTRKVLIEISGCLLKNFDNGTQHLGGCEKFVEETWRGGLKVDIPQCCSPPPPIVLIGEQEMYSGLKWRWHLVPNLSCLNYPGADKGWSFNKSWEQQIAGVKDTDEVSWGLFPAWDKNLQREVGRGSSAVW